MPECFAIGFATQRALSRSRASRLQPFVLTLRDRDKLGHNLNGNVAHDVADRQCVNTKAAVAFLEDLNSSEDRNRIFRAYGDVECKRVTSSYKKILRGNIYVAVGNYRNRKQIAHGVRAHVAYSVKIGIGMRLDFTYASAGAFTVMPISITQRFIKGVRVLCLIGLFTGVIPGELHIIARCRKYRHRDK